MKVLDRFVSLSDAPEETYCFYSQFVDVSQRLIFTISCDGPQAAMRKRLLIVESFSLFLRSVQTHKF